jgi:hypothetical protein
MKWEYTGSYFRILVEFYCLRLAVTRYRVMSRREGEAPRRRMLRGVMRRLADAKPDGRT